MMKSRGAAIRTLIILSCVLVSAKAKGDVDTTLYKLWREFEHAQERAAFPRRLNQGSETVSLAVVAKAISTAPASVWTASKNSSIIPHFLISGGPARPVRDLIAQQTKFGGDEPVILAALAFAENSKEAASQLGELEPTALPAKLGAAVALAQGIALRDQPERARKSFRLAQLLAPGTVIDESALRREVSSFIAEGRKLEALNRSTRYFWRFGHSVYANEAAKFLALEVLPDVLKTELTTDAPARFLTSLPSSVRRRHLIDLGRSRLVLGDLKSVDYVTALLRDQNGLTPAEEIRLRMFTSITQALRGTPGRALEELRGIDTSSLDHAEVAILRSSVQLISYVTASPSATENEVNEADRQFSSVEEARLSIERADRVLAGVH